jgi:hypothetical protein
MSITPQDLFFSDCKRAIFMRYRGRLSGDTDTDFSEGFFFPLTVTLKSKILLKTNSVAVDKRILKGVKSQVSPGDVRLCGMRDNSFLGRRRRAQRSQLLRSREKKKAECQITPPLSQITEPEGPMPGLVQHRLQG